MTLASRPELQELLARAAATPTVHRERVHEAGERAINEQADVLERLKGNKDAGNPAP